MSQREKTEWLVTVEGDGVFRVEHFHPSKYAQARELYSWWLVRYPKDKVTLQKVGNEQVQS